MTSPFIRAACGAILLTAAGLALAQDAPSPQQAQPAARMRMQENANASAQASSDTSYGGSDETASARGAMHSRHCASGPQCNLYFGR